MMTAAQSLAQIATMLERAMTDLDAGADVRGLLIGAHTHAVIQCVAQRRAEARAAFAAYPELEHGAVQ
jgi:nicotinic acid phosphoribosyltransferase